MVELKSVAINVVIILLFVNAAPNLLLASGVAADLGIDPAVSGDQPINSTNQNLQNIEPSGGAFSTLFTLYTSVTEPVRAVMAIFFGAPIILSSAGVPHWVLTFLFVPQYLVVGATIIYMLSQRGL